MVTRNDLKMWVVDALRAKGGRAHLVGVCEHIWNTHKSELEDSDKLLFTWQYDVRWAATKLRHEGVLQSANKKGIWELSKAE